MESNELRIFQAVAHEGSITKAAKTLGYVQSNVTARIQQLEVELKTQLFYRQRGMVLTQLVRNYYLTQKKSSICLTKLTKP